MILALSAMMMLAAPSAGPPDTPSATQRDLIRAVADAFDENRAKFPFGKVAFRYRDGKITSFDEAKLGHLGDAHEARCSYTYDGPRAAYEQRFTLESMAATTVWSSPSSSSGYLRSFRLLTNGKRTLREVIIPSRDGLSESKGRVILPGAADFYYDIKFPIDLGFPDASRDDLSQNLRMVLEGRPNAHIDSINPDAVFEGIKVIQIRLKMKNGYRTFWVDLNRGAIPIRTYDEVYDGNKDEYYYGKIQHVSGHGWLPFEFTYSPFEGRARRVEIDRVSFDKPPDAGAFRMEMDQPTGIGDQAAGVGYNQPRKVWDLDHLPAAGSPGVIPLRQGPAAGGPMNQPPGERDPPPRYFTYGSVALAAILGIGVVLWKIRR